MLRSTLAALLLSSLLVPACASEDGANAEDGEHDTVAGKSDSFSGADARLILGLVNDGSVDAAKLDGEAGVSARVAEAIVKHRDGADGKYGTKDDDLFDDLEELDAIPYLGTTAMAALHGFAKTGDAGTTLRIDLVAQEYKGDGNWVDVKLDSLNAQLSSIGVAFPKTLTLAARDGAKFAKLLADLEKANTKLDRKIELDHTWDPSEYSGLCYTGDVRGIQRAVDGLRESMFSEYMGVQADRWGKLSRFYYSGAGGESEAEWLDLQREEHPETVAVWKGFDTTSTSYLMMTDGGQQGDGTEFFAVLIPKCR